MNANILSRITSIFQFLFFLNGFGVDGQAQNWEHNWLQTINRDRNKGLDQTAIHFSNSVLPLAIAFPLGEWVVGIAKKDKLKTREAIISGLGMVVHVGITQGLKYSFNRKRPYEIYSDLDPVSMETGPSFPSGHTGLAFHTATAISLQYPKWYVVVPASVWATSVGYSRMHLGVHYPTDVLAGALVGVGTAWLSNKVNIWLKKEKKPNVKSTGTLIQF